MEEDAETLQESNAIQNLLLYGVSVKNQEPDSVIIEWATEALPMLISLGPTTAIILADKFSVILRESMQDDNKSNVLGRIILRYGDNRFKRATSSVGKVYYLQTSNMLLLTLDQNRFDKTPYNFVEQLLMPSVQEVVYVQRRDTLSILMSRQSTPHRLSIITTHSSPLIDSIAESFPLLEEGHLIQHTAAAFANYSHTHKIASAIVLFEVDLDDLYSIANDLYSLGKIIESTLGSERFSVISPAKNKEIYQSWKKRVSVSDVNHLYL
jgi:hypothetical protein